MAHPTENATEAVALAAMLEDLAITLEKRVEERTADLQREIAERKRMEAELVRAQKLEALGRLVAGIAHEINNPLAFVLSNLQFLGEELAKPIDALEPGTLDETREVISEAIDGAERIRRIVKDLKSFSRETDSKVEPVDLSQVILSTLTLVRSDAAKVARLEHTLADLPPAAGNTSRLGQVFLNLFVNAVQAIPPGAPQLHRIHVRSLEDADGWLRVEVSDSGGGIPEAIQKRIFDPFFTTKPLGTGTGLGLSLCHGLIEGMGGEIGFISEEGKGTTFFVRLKKYAPQ